NAYIHWYHQIPSEGPKRLLYIKSAQEISYDENSYRSKYSPTKTEKNVCTLSVTGIDLSDEGIYYCAYWESHRISRPLKACAKNKGTTAPKNYEILSSEDENKLTYVCLVEKFYPEVIRVTWTEGEKEVTDNVVNGDIWKSADNDEYSIGSWLTIPKENKNKKYSCKYEHESQVHSISTTSIQGGCRISMAKQDFSVFMFIPDHLMHRTAYLVYIVLLLKSSMYYVIVLFFIYR
ncbi:IGL1 protein, partial [Casuarius casuarius]|nr:IGL1 protein [Casuarius casuarius]